jgi:CHASE2 domain-containing sensor protein
MSIVNQYSFLWITAIAFGGLLLLYRRRPRRELAISAAALAVGCLIAFLLFSPEASEPTPTSPGADLIGAGTPVLLEFQSPY